MALLGLPHALLVCVRWVFAPYVVVVHRTAAARPFPTRLGRGGVGRMIVGWSHDAWACLLCHPQQLRTSPTCECALVSAVLSGCLQHAPRAQVRRTSVHTPACPDPRLTRHLGCRFARACFDAGFKLLYKCRTATRAALPGSTPPSSVSASAAIMRHNSEAHCTRVLLLGHAHLVLSRAASAVARAAVHG